MGLPANDETNGLSNVAPTPLQYCEIVEGIENQFTNVLLIDSCVPDYQTFVTSVNSSTFPIVYSTMSTKTELLELLQKMFTSIPRIGIVFTSTSENSKTFLDCEPLFKEVEPYSENVQFIIDVIKEFSVTNIDYLGCNTLNYTSWRNYYNVVTLNTGVIVGASNDKTGNIKYGGDWTMESTGQDIELIYFTQSIKYYTYLLDNVNTSILAATGTYPLAITIDSAGNIYTANSGSHNVSKITPAGESTILASTGTNTRPNAITIDSAGNIYTANYGTNNVSKISLQVSVVAIIGSIYPVSGSSEGGTPVSISVSSAVAINGVVFAGVPVVDYSFDGGNVRFHTPPMRRRETDLGDGYAGHYYTHDEQVTMTLATSTGSCSAVGFRYTPRHARPF